MFCLVFKSIVEHKFVFSREGHSAEPAKHRDSETSAVQSLGRKTVDSPHSQAVRVVGFISNLCFPQKDTEAQGNTQLALKNAGLNSAVLLCRNCFQ